MTESKRVRNFPEPSKTFWNFPEPSSKTLVKRPSTKKTLFSPKKIPTVFGREQSAVQYDIAIVETKYNSFILTKSPKPALLLVAGLAGKVGG